MGQQQTTLDREGVFFPLKNKQTPTLNICFSVCILRINITRHILIGRLTLITTLDLGAELPRPLALTPTCSYSEKLI